MRRIIVLGGSAGGIAALCKILERLPADLQAALMAVIHIAESNNRLSQVFARCSALDVVSPSEATPIKAGSLYLPLPDRHLVVRDGCVTTNKGPRENRHRPAVNTLFRSAARSYRSAVIGVVLSGALDDGSAGAMAIKARGGTVLVQDPEEADVPDMPLNVIRQVKPDFCLPLNEIAKKLVELVADSPELRRSQPSTEQCRAEDNPDKPMEREPMAFTCPDCGGALTQFAEGKNVEFRCHVGHRFSLESFTEAHADALERALWVAMRRLNEQRAIQQTLAQQEDLRQEMRKRHAENAAVATEDMRLLQEILQRL